MSKVDEYTGNGMIVVSDGEVWAVDDSGLPDVIGEIGRVECANYKICQYANQKT